MTNILIINEKSSQGKNFAKALGGNSGTLSNGDKYKILTASGHLKELIEPQDYDEKYKSWNLLPIKIPGNNFKYRVKAKRDKNGKIARNKDDKVLIDPGKRKQIDNITQALKSVDEVYLATDYDNEGEVIARQAIQDANFKGKVKRLRFGDEAKESIIKAIEDKKDISSTEGMYQAGLSRAKADFIIGLNLTRLATNKAREAGFYGVFNVGSDKTPVMAMVLQRDREIENFKSRDYLTIVFKDSHNNVYRMPKNKKYFLDEDGKIKAQQDLAKIKQDKIGKITKEEKRQPSPKLFQFSALNGYLAKKFNITTDETMTLYQILYDNTFLSYPRTEGDLLTESEFNDLISVKDDLAKAVGINQDISLENTSIRSRYVSKKDLVHRANTPTKNVLTKENLEKLISENKSKVSKIPKAFEKTWTIYTEITKRTLAMFAPDFVYTKTSAELLDNPSYKSFGNQVRDQGWRLVTGTQYNAETTTFVQGDLSNPELVSDKTKSPKKFSIDSMLEKNGELDKKDIGTAATRPIVISDLIKLKYLEQGKKSILTATDKTQLLIDFLTKGDSELIDLDLSRKWRDELDDIVKNPENSKKFVEKMINVANNEVLRLSKIDMNTITTKMEKSLSSSNLLSDKEVSIKNIKYNLKIIEGKSKLGKKYKVYKFKNENEDFSIFATAFSIVFSPEEVISMLEGKQVYKENLISKKNKKYSANFIIENNKITFGEKK